MNKLQKALRVNALFSGVSGIGFIVFNRSLASLFNIQQNNIFWMIGIGLIFFAGTIFLEMKKQRCLAVWWIIIQDFIWVIGSVTLLVLKPFKVSYLGNIIIAVIAFIVLFMALNQLKEFKNSKN